MSKSEKRQGKVTLADFMASAGLLERTYYRKLAQGAVPKARRVSYQYIPMAECVRWFIEAGIAPVVPLKAMSEGDIADDDSSV